MFLKAVLSTCHKDFTSLIHQFGDCVHTDKTCCSNYYNHILINIYVGLLFSIKKQFIVSLSSLLIVASHYIFLSS